VDRAEGGLGIGLALVKSLVGMHGGTVIARSEGLGQGSEFIVRLPLDVEVAATPRPERGAASTAARTRRRRVLGVDDNIDAAEMLGAALGQQGHHVVVVNDPVAALAAVEDFSPEVAVVDIGLPVMDGYELAGKLLAAPGARQCRLIALTGYGQEADKRRSKEAGFEMHLVKPVDMTRLLSLVEADAASKSAP
jgi:CheY-like chemotaxis protein